MLVRKCKEGQYMRQERDELKGMDDLRVRYRDLEGPLFKWFDQWIHSGCSAYYRWRRWMKEGSKHLIDR